MHFDVGDKAIDERLSSQLKEIYAIAFCDEKDDQLVNFTDLALTWCCTKREEAPTSARIQVGLLRALVVAGSGGGDPIVPAGRGVKCGPTVSCKQLEYALVSDLLSATVNPTALFAEARRIEGGGGGASGEENTDEQKEVVSFSSLHACKSLVGVDMFVLEDLFGL